MHYKHSLLGACTFTFTSSSDYWSFNTLKIRMRGTREALIATVDRILKYEIPKEKYAKNLTKMAILS
jgi:hypothetical protein